MSNTKETITLTVEEYEALKNKDNNTSKETVEDNITRLQRIEKEKAEIESSMTPEDMVKIFAIQNGCDLATAKTAVKLGQVKQNSAVLNAVMRYRARVSYSSVNNGISEAVSFNNFKNLGF